MKVLIPKGRWNVPGASYMVEFTPIHNDWLSWKTNSGNIKIVHEKCYLNLMLSKNEILEYVTNEDAACAMCGGNAPDSVKKFILLANGVHEYK